MLSFSLPLPVVFLYIHIYSFLPGTSMRNPTRGKGHEEGSLTKRKGVIRLQGFPLEFPEHPPPKKPESACFTVLCFPPTLLTLQGAVPPPPFSRL